MKKSLILGLLSLAATAATTFGQGVIVLDNYDSSGPNVTYGQAGIPANGTSGTLGTSGSAVSSGSWTVGVYFVSGTVAVPADPTGTADPSTLSGGLVLGTGIGSSVALAGASANHNPGQFLATPWGIPGSSALGNQTYTLEIVVYSGADYGSSGFRGHSGSFQVVTSANTSNTPNFTGNAMPAFSVFAVPEPSVLALSGIGGALLMLFRRKK